MPVMNNGPFHADAEVVVKQGGKEQYNRNKKCPEPEMHKNDAARNTAQQKKRDDDQPEQDTSFLR